MGPLNGFKVIELASVGPVPMCGMLLADLGAHVIRVDRVHAADLGLRRDPAFEFSSRGKRSISVDLKNARGVEVVQDLIARSDVLIEGYRPGVLERMGLGPEVCLAANPSLVIGRLTGWGQTGPLAKQVGHDMNFIALTGALDAIGTRGGPPVPPLNLLGDLAGGALFMAYGIAAALAAPGGRGRGQVVDMAITDGVAALMANIHGESLAGAWPPGRGEHVLGGGAPWNTVYETRDGRYVAVCPVENRFYEALVARLGVDPVSLPDRMDRAQWPALHDIFSRTFRSRTMSEWTAIYAGSDACVSPVLTVEEARLHPQAQSRAAFPVLHGKAQPAPAPRYERTTSEIHGEPIMAPGQHTQGILREIGWSECEIASLLSDGAVATPAQRNGMVR